MSSNLDWEHISQTDIINTKKHLEIDQEKLKSSFDRLERSLDEELAKLGSDFLRPPSLPNLPSLPNSLFDKGYLGEVKSTLTFYFSQLSQLIFFNFQTWEK